MTLRAQSRLAALREDGLKTLYPARLKVMVGCSTCGLAAGAEAVVAAITARARESSLDIVLARTGCVGHCQEEPLVDVLLPGAPRVTYRRMNPAKAASLVDALKTGKLPKTNALSRLPTEEIVVEDRLHEYGPAEVAADIPLRDSLPYYAKQRRIALRNCGTVDPRSVQE